MLCFILRETTVKICTLCKIKKPFDSFSKASREKDGLQHRCKACNKAVSAAYRLMNPEKESLRHAKYHAENKEAINKRVSQWQKENRDRCRAKSRRFYHANREKERARMAKWTAKNPDWNRKNTKKWREKNAIYYAQYDRLNKARRLKALAIWADFKKIEKIYLECQRISKKTGVPHHVDHIIPLVSKFVCGLHCEDNLQILSQDENLSKGNRFSSYSY